MIPAVNARPSTGGGYREPDGFSGKDSGHRRWQGAHARPRFSDNGSSGPAGRPDHRQPPAVPRLVRETLSDQQEAQVKKGFDLLRKTPAYSLEIARELHKTAPNTVSVCNLEARALTELGRYEEVVAVLDRLSCEYKAQPCLRMSRGRALQELGRFDEAEVEFRGLYEHHSRTPKRKKIHGLALGRLLQHMGGKREQEALMILTQVRRQLAGKPDSACDDLEVELALSRLLQQMGGRKHWHSALAILTHLRQEKAGNRANTPCDDRNIEMAVARVLQDLGGKNVQKAHTIWLDLHQKMPRHREIALSLAISLNRLATPDSRREALTQLTAMRQRAAGNKVDTPCDDRGIELALAKVLRDLGGLPNRAKSLAILTRLRQRAARGQPDTPCADRAVELALGKYWEEEGGHDNQHKALAILTEQRLRANGGRADRPSNDRGIEIALGSLLARMGGEENLHKALAILIPLRTLSGSKDQQTPCDNQEIEFPIAICLKELHEWQQFDRWNSERPRFESHEIELLQSIRYFREFLEKDTCHKPRPELLQKAFRHAQIAVDESHRFDPSSLSQLGHCYRALSLYLPAARQQVFGLKASDAEIYRCSRGCFDEAAQLDPSRKNQDKDELWRQWERAWREQVKEPPWQRSKEASRSHERDEPPTETQREQGATL